MSAPSLRPATLDSALSRSVPAGVQVFSVARDGDFGGRRYRAGELAVVEGVPEEGDPVVLVAVGPGRPRLGRVHRNQLLGEHGEPCLMSRWEVAGRVVGVIRAVGTGWAVEMFAQPGVIGMASEVPAAPATAAPEPVAQLDLFAA